ncbi:xylanase [Flavobacterium sp. Sd200]|uniref:glycoside hydrolase n=1 Tax=Flavobacterium sp. Sd200 TaxID=2692211 RepID=UPI00136F676F|nr:glycoside hydrolase [Flavobacterium sp. Sd200]MXN93292.1 xylanase [Flavobacterium sp. Sd200]
MHIKNIYNKYVLLIACTVFSSCGSYKSKNSTTTNSVQPVALRIDDAVTYQTIEHFGASDAWSCQFVGNWPDAKRNAIADLLFSQNTDVKGNPLGIGLSLWRFNIGAGSAEQGTESGIGDEWRRAESFLQPDGSYDWNRQKGQVWFAHAAKQRNVGKLLIFPNSPPVSLTQNGKAFANKDLKTNLQSSKFEAYANYLATVAQGMQKMGLTPDYISPMNEPQWDWNDGGQEGTPFYNNEIAQVAKLLDQKISDKGLTAKINLAEAGQINYLYEEHNRTGRANQVKDFFVQGSPNYIGNLKNLDNSISGHSYFTTSPFATSVAQRQQLATSVNQISGLKYWMSEYCILGDNDGEIKGNGRDLGITSALYLARTIHTDLAEAQATAWHWWVAISPYDYKDGLVYIDMNKTDGTFYESKMLWSLGNYSRFIRPGYQRVNIENVNSTTTDKNFLFSAYKDAATGKLVTVIINSGNDAVPVTLQHTKALKGELEVYVTSADKDLELLKVEAKRSFTVPAQSILTVVSKSK